ncbi:hypothetical protein BU16DRAFT_342585 [Lophium mytilinum]|uniref:Uncharacterized protein n=1 Tax=Lophium mytilinum TaxID=390894 RepID=A0A6A6QYW3_9PEZI|nr:hypothetical protein BU16DRAFT_342585 [Lophium mytilinum]
MADSMAGIPSTPSPRRARPNALAEIQFASIIDPDLTPSEDESSDPQGFQPEDAQSVIGVSIGQAQTRLTSPKTPAAEKAAALEDVEGGGLFDSSWEKSPEGTPDEEQREFRVDTALEEKRETDQRTPERPTTPPAVEVSPASPPARLPSPWKSGPRKFQRLDETRNTLRESLSGHRRRASSGGSTSETLKKYLSSFNLPSMPKSPNLLNFSLPGFSTSSVSDSSHAGDHTVEDAQRSKRQSRAGSPSLVQLDGPSHSQARHDPKAASQRHSIVATSPPQRDRPPPVVHSELADIHSDRPHPLPTPDRLRAVQTPTHHPKLRRSASDNSLLMHRSLSRASSLGDDSRFEHVQEQVNSRIKAIKDSWQDANFKLPSLPTMPNFNFGTSRLDYARQVNPIPTKVPVKRIGNEDTATVPRKISLSKANQTSTNAGMTSSNAASHPYFTGALKDLTGDVVILGGYRGSILRSADTKQQVWAPIKVGLNLRKVDLEVGLEPEDEESMEERIIEGGMLTNIGPVDISRRLFKRLRASENYKNGTLRVHNYGYDWRLSPHLLSRRLATYLSNLPCNRPDAPPGERGAIVIAHSLGGLITRHVINKQPDLVSGVVYAGVPQTCVNILGPLRNGDDVLLSSRVLTAQVNFTIRTSFALLPLDGRCFIDRNTREEYPVDFFDINTWIDCRLSPCIAYPLPALNSIPSTSSISGLLSSMSSVIPSSIISRKSSISRGSNSGSSGAGGSVMNSNGVFVGTTPSSSSTINAREVSASKSQHAANAAEGGAERTGFAPQMGHKNNSGSNDYNNPASSSPSTTSTIPKDKAIAYLTRVLAEVKKFKQELDFESEYAKTNRYPPIAVIYGKSTPTVYGAKVESRDTIKRADAYDELAFASGDGVVLARAAMVPDGYSVVRGGVVSSNRGHVTLLGDLEAVGRCLSAVIGARKAGVGMGPEAMAPKPKVSEQQDGKGKEKKKGKGKEKAKA